MNRPGRPKNAAERLAGSHPLRYRLSADPAGVVFERCHVCEQWSPCDVRELMHAVDPGAGYLDDEPVVEIDKDGFVVRGDE